MRDWLSKFGVKNSASRRAVRPIASALFSFIALSLWPLSHAAASTDNDFQQWSLVFVNHHINDKWSARWQFENRLRDDASEVDKQVYKPGGYYQFTDTLQLGVGRNMTKRLKIEVGYLWNYQRFREGPNHSNHVLRLQFLIDTKGLHPWFAGT